MRIVYLTEFFSDGMGYSANGLPKALALRGHDVHVVASDLQVYGTSLGYERTYGRFLGPAKQPVGMTATCGFSLHRLRSVAVNGYVYSRGLPRLLHQLKPDVVQAGSCVLPNALVAGALRRFISYALFTECHQHRSVSRPAPRPFSPYWLSRTIPGSLLGRACSRCFAIAPDCADVAATNYGVQPSKIVILPLGTDTTLFVPRDLSSTNGAHSDLRRAWGASERTTVFIYTGRLSQTKNPLLLAVAVANLAREGQDVLAVFIGDGPQRQQISRCPHARVISFTRHSDLPPYYQAADVGVWPEQESISMLDAMSSGLPLVANDRMGDPERVLGCGSLFLSGSAEALADALRPRLDSQVREREGAVARKKAVEKYSWAAVATAAEKHYADALPSRR